MSHQSLQRAESPRELQVNEHFRLTRDGLVITGSPSIEACQAFAPRLCMLEQSVQFAIGEFVLYCERMFGEQASQVIDHDVFSEETVRIYRWVAEKVAPENRLTDKLSFRHHMAVAKLSPQLQRQWLKRALGQDEEGGRAWPVSRLTAAIKAGTDGHVTALWLVVRCEDQKDLDSVRKQMEGQGRVCKITERREKEPKRVTARARRSSKHRRARSKG